MDDVKDLLQEWVDKGGFQEQPCASCRGVS